MVTVDLAKGTHPRGFTLGKGKRRRKKLKGGETLSSSNRGEENKSDRLKKKPEPGCVIADEKKEGAKK